MLEIINNLSSFFEDCYRRVNVREYARIMKISPPTASNILKLYHKENLLKKETYKNYILFYANKEDKTFRDLSRIFWDKKLKEFTEYLEKSLINPTIILFGSLSKAETKKDSDIDLAIFSYKKDINILKYEKKLKRKIQIFWFNSIQDIKSKELANNIINGYLIRGKIIL